MEPAKTLKIPNGNPKP